MSGMRLSECVSALHELETDYAKEVFGRVDAGKLRSSLTLFEAVAMKKAPLVPVLEKFFDGKCDLRGQANPRADDIEEGRWVAEAAASVEGLARRLHGKCPWQPIFRCATRGIPERNQDQR